MAGAAPELRDIHLPAAPGFWPPAPGWWLLAALLLALLCWAAWILRGRLRRRARQRRLLAEFDGLHPAVGDAAAVPRYLAELSAFLRRLSRAVRADAANLRGAEWIGFLDRHGDGFAPFADALNDAPYRPRSEVDAAALHALARRHLQRVLETELRHV